MGQNRQKTGKPRELQVDKAIAYIDFDQVNIGSVTPVKSTINENKEILFDNEHFKLWRIKSNDKFTVGFKDEPAILVCKDGIGSMTYNSNKYSIHKGEVILLSAIIRPLSLHLDESITLLQIALPEISKK